MNIPQRSTGTWDSSIFLLCHPWCRLLYSRSLHGPRWLLDIHPSYFIPTIERKRRSTTTTTTKVHSCCLSPSKEILHKFFPVISTYRSFARIQIPGHIYLQNTFPQVKSGIWFYLTYKLWNFPVTISWMLTETKDSWVFINHYPAYLYRLPWPLGPMGMMPWAWMTACTCNGLHYWRRAPSFEKHNIL